MLSRYGLSFPKLSLRIHELRNALFLALRDQIPSLPFSFGRSKVALATLDMVPFQLKLVAFLSSSSSVFSQLGISPAWYQMMDRHMVLATMALSTGNEDNLVPHVQL